MNSPRRSDPLRRSRITIILVALTLMGLVYLLPRPMGNLASMVLAPFDQARLWFRESGHALPTYFRDRSVFEREIRDLKAELALYEAQGVVVEETVNTGRIEAPVIRVPNETPYDTVVVAAGSEDGIKEGALAYAEGAAVGSVASVYPKTSIVVLFSTAGVEVPVYLWGTSVFARGEGVGGGVVRIGIPQGLPVAAGDAVTIPVPGSAIFGKVDHIEADPTNPEQYVFVSHRKALRSLRVLAIDPEVIPEVTREDALRAIEAVRGGLVPSPFTPLLESLPAATSTATSTTP